MDKLLADFAYNLDGQLRVFFYLIPTFILNVVLAYVSVTYQCNSTLFLVSFRRVSPIHSLKKLYMLKDVFFIVPKNISFYFPTIVIRLDSDQLGRFIGLRIEHPTNLSHHLVWTHI